MEYSNQEITEMHLMYGRAQCNANEARRLYSEQFPNRRLPNSKTFQRIHERLEYGKEWDSQWCGNQKPALQLMVAILSTFCTGFRIRRKNVSCKLNFINTNHQKWRTLIVKWSVLCTPHIMPVTWKLRKIDHMSTWTFLLVFKSSINSAELSYIFCYTLYINTKKIDLTTCNTLNTVNTVGWSYKGTFIVVREIGT